MTEFIFDDGGRNTAGFKGAAGDCVVRAIAIATAKDYKEIYNDLFKLSKAEGFGSPRGGVHRKVYDKYLKELGFKLNQTMGYRTGCKVHFTKDELPQGIVIARLSRHLSTMVNGVIHDTFDPSRDGTRCVYGYYSK